MHLQEKSGLPFRLQVHCIGCNATHFCLQWDFIGCNETHF